MPKQSNAKKRILGGFLSCALLFSSCQERTSTNGEQESLKAEVANLSSTLELVKAHTTSPWTQSSSQTTSKFGIYDQEHKKLVGFIEYPSPPPVGSIILWDDDVYQVTAIRFHMKKEEEKPAQQKALFRKPDVVELFVKFFGKVEPPR